MLKNKYDKYFLIFVVVLLLFSSFPISGGVDFTRGYFWSELTGDGIDDTVVLTNFTSNVSIGNNATTTYKLNVEGESRFSDDIHVFGTVQQYGTGDNVFNQEVSCAKFDAGNSGIEIGSYGSIEQVGNDMCFLNEDGVGLHIESSDFLGSWDVPKISFVSDLATWGAIDSLLYLVGTGPALWFTPDPYMGVDIAQLQWAVNTERLWLRNANCDEPYFDIEFDDTRISQYLKHMGDTNTHLQFRGDRTTFTSGGKVFMDMVESTDDYTVMNSDYYQYADSDAGGYIRSEKNNKVTIYDPADYTNESVALQTALDEQGAYARHYITGAMDIANIHINKADHSFVHIQGTGGFRPYLNLESGTDKHMFYLENVHNFGMSDLHLYGNFEGDNLHAFYVNSSYNVFMDNLYVLEFSGDGLHIEYIAPDSVRNIDWCVRDCVWEDCNGIGINITGGSAERNFFQGGYSYANKENIRLKDVDNNHFINMNLGDAQQTNINITGDSDYNVFSDLWVSLGGGDIPFVYHNINVTGTSNFNSFNSVVCLGDTKKDIMVDSGATNNYFDLGTGDFQFFSQNVMDATHIRMWNEWKNFAQGKTTVADNEYINHGLDEKAEIVHVTQYYPSNNMTHVNVDTTPNDTQFRVNVRNWDGTAHVLDDIWIMWTAYGFSYD